MKTEYLGDAYQAVYLKYHTYTIYELMLDAPVAEAALVRNDDVIVVAPGRRAPAAALAPPD